MGETRKGQADQCCKCSFCDIDSSVCWVKGEDRLVNPGETKNGHGDNFIWNENQSRREMVQEWRVAQPRIIYFSGIKKRVDRWTKWFEYQLHFVKKNPTTVWLPCQKCNERACNHFTYVCVCLCFCLCKFGNFEAVSHHQNRYLLWTEPYRGSLRVPELWCLNLDQETAEVSSYFPKSFQKIPKSHPKIGCGRFHLKYSQLISHNNCI